MAGVGVRVRVPRVENLVMIDHGQRAPREDHLSRCIMHQVMRESVPYATHPHLPRAALMHLIGVVGRVRTRVQVTVGVRVRLPWWFGFGPGFRLRLGLGLDPPG